MKFISGWVSRAQALATWLFSFGERSLYSSASLWPLHRPGQVVSLAYPLTASCRPMLRQTSTSTTQLQQATARIQHVCLQRTLRQV